MEQVEVVRMVCLKMNTTMICRCQPNIFKQYILNIFLYIGRAFSVISDHTFAVNVLSLVAKTDRLYTTLFMIERTASLKGGFSSLMISKDLRHE